MIIINNIPLCKDLANFDLLIKYYMLNDYLRAVWGHGIHFDHFATEK